MKRFGNLFEKVVAFENLRLAAKKALRGKQEKTGAALFYFHLETELFNLQEELRSGRYQMRPYRLFMITDPKPRKICAAGFRDRVVHHAVCNLLDPVFEKSMITDTYACRRGRGSHAAVKKAQVFARRFPFFLKCDVRKYFENIDHGVLKTLLRRKIKDEALLDLLGRIIDHPIPGGRRGKGIPIGNLTSQYAANLYLGELDHFLKERLRLKGYVRYMDDFLIFSASKAHLYEILALVRDYLKNILLLELKEEALLLAPVTEGIPFLGFRVFPGMLKLDGKKWAKFRRGIGKLEKNYSNGLIDEETLVRSVSSMLGHIAHADTLMARRRFFDKSLSLGLRPKKARTG